MVKEFEVTVDGKKFRVKKENLSLEDSVKLVINEKEERFQISPQNRNYVQVKTAQKNKPFYVNVKEIEEGVYLVEEYGVKHLVSVKELKIGKRGEKGEVIVKAPMAGKVVSLKVKNRGKVARGELLLIIESMKMENEIRTPVEGVITEVMVREGAFVNQDDVLIKISQSFT